MMNWLENVAGEVAGGNIISKQKKKVTMVRYCTCRNQRALLELGIGSCKVTKSHTLIPAARRVSMRSSGDSSKYMISIVAGEAGLG